MRPTLLPIAVALGLLASPAAADPVAGREAQAVAQIVASPAFRDAAATLARDHDRMVADIITLTEIPAPPFKEAARANAYAEMFRQAGLADVAIDPEGNVTGLRRGIGSGRLVVMSAHLDTVFPEGTDVKVRREGTKLFAPGVGDDTRSLAVLLAYVRAMDAAKIRTVRDILFVGTVGEEGQGDLRGVRHLFAKSPYRDRIEAFFSMDGASPGRVTNGGVGSKRYRVTFRGPGGHSYGAFGIVNPMAAQALAVTKLYEIQPPQHPKVTYSAGVTGGGTSVNAIPGEVWIEVDMRSESAAELARLDRRFLAIVDEAVAHENTARATTLGKISAEAKVIGERPAGATPAGAGVVQAVVAAAAAMGYPAQYEASSTDANLPMSLGIPAVTIGSGGTGGRAHSLDEWIDVEPTASVRGMSVGLAALLATAGVN